MRPVVGALAVAVLLAGCGSHTLTSAQLHSRATRACAAADRRAHRIPDPQGPAQALGFLRRGIGALRPELVALRRLRAPDSESGTYATAVHGLADALGRLRVAAGQIEAGGDPIAVMRTLEEGLSAGEPATERAFSALGLRRCADP